MDFELKNIMNAYTREEVPIWSRDTYKEMLKIWPNDQELTLYRGINFSDKDAFDTFKEKLESNGAYIESCASGFSEVYDVAKGFALISKSYYLSRDVMENYSDQRILSERISGYRGVVLKVTVPAGSVVDVQKSGKSIENEYLFEPGLPIKVELVELKSFYEMTQEPNFDFNQEIMKEINKVIDNNLTAKNKSLIIHNPFIRFVKINNPEKITEEIADIICQADLSIHINYKKSEKGHKGESFEVLDVNDYLSITKFASKKFGIKQPDEIVFSPLDILEYKEEGYLTKNNTPLFKKIAKDTLYTAIEAHIKYRDDENISIKYEGLASIVPFLSNDDKELHRRMLSYKVKETYESLNEEIAKAFKQSGGKKIDKEISKLTDFLNSIVQGIGKSEKAIELDEIKRNKDVVKAKERRNIKFGQ